MNEKSVNTYEARRLPWKRGGKGLENWYTACPDPKDDMQKACIHKASGRPNGEPNWVWNIRYGAVVRSGVEHSKQEAADAATIAWWQEVDRSEPKQP